MVAEQREHILRVLPLKGRFLKPAVIDAIEQRRLLCRQIAFIHRYGKFLVEDAADVAMPVATKHLDRPAMRQLDIVHGSCGGRQIGETRGMMPPEVA